jgi:hypothetical protein
MRLPALVQQERGLLQFAQGNLRLDEGNEAVLSHGVVDEEVELLLEW